MTFRNSDYLLKRIILRMNLMRIIINLIKK